MPGCSAPMRVEPATLIQIRRGYVTDCSGLHLSVETDAEGWKAEVRDRKGGSTLYAAKRCSAVAAKVAAAEFALWSGTAMHERTAEVVSNHLAWREFW